MSPSNIAASIRARLLNKARTEKLDYNLLLTRYVLERMLYCLSISEQPRPRTGMSKSHLIAWKQCPRRLWLEVNQPELRQVEATASACFVLWHRVGGVASGKA